MRFCHCPAAACAVLPAAIVLTAVDARAQWTVVSLHPPEASSSIAYDVHEGQQVGYVQYGHHSSPSRAAMWSGSPESLVILAPLPEDGAARRVHGAQQVGQVDIGDVRKASLWTGSAGSWVQLAPARSFHSWAHDADDGRQVGAAEVPAWGLELRAGIWSGTAESWFELHPPGAIQSEARGIHNGRQVGSVWLADRIRRASLWGGTPGSWVDLHPPGAEASACMAIHGEHQGGYFEVAGQRRAAMWTGTAASHVDLHPPSAIRSYVHDVHGGMQVGYAQYDEFNRACLWRGSLASMDELPTPGYSSAKAEGIWSDGSVVYIAGSGYNESARRTEALLWMAPVCPADCDASGDLDFFDFLCFQNLFAADDPAADCDGSSVHDFFDFLCFQNAFAAGCP